MDLVRAYIDGYNQGKTKVDQLKSSDRYMIQKLLDMYQEAQLKGEMELHKNESIPPMIIGLSNLAKACLIGDATAKKNLRRLQEAGLIKVESGRGKPLQIRINLDVLYVEFGQISEAALESYETNRSYSFK